MGKKKIVCFDISGFVDSNNIPKVIKKALSEMGLSLNPEI